MVLSNGIIPAQVCMLVAILRFCLAKDTVAWSTGEVEGALECSVGVADGVVELNTGPDASRKGDVALPAHNAEMGRVPANACTRSEKTCGTRP